MVGIAARYEYTNKHFHTHTPPSQTQKTDPPMHIRRHASKSPLFFVLSARALCVRRRPTWAVRHRPRAWS